MIAGGRARERPASLDHDDHGAGFGAEIDGAVCVRDLGQKVCPLEDSPAREGWTSSLGTTNFFAFVRGRPSGLAGASVQEYDAARSKRRCQYVAWGL